MTDFSKYEPYHGSREERNARVLRLEEENSALRDILESVIDSRWNTDLASIRTHHPKVLDWSWDGILKNPVEFVKFRRAYYDMKEMNP